MPPRRIGILGGLGPIAGAHFHRRLLDRAAQLHGCVQDHDFPPITLQTVPLREGWGSRGFDEAAAERVRETIRLGLLALAHGGCGVLVMACNTVHAFLPDLRRAVPATIIDMVGATIEVAEPHGRVAVLASETTHRLGLYRALPGSFVAATQPHVNEAIVAVMGGRIDEADVHLRRALHAVHGDDLGAVVLGCTELSVIPRRFWRRPIISSMDCAIDQALNAAMP